MSLQLDHDAHEGMRTALALATSGRAGALVVDLSEVSFIDSTGMGTLLRADDQLAGEGVRMVVVCPPGPVQRLLAMTRLDGRLALEPDRLSALARARTAEGGAGG
jgi:anti-sigma B factor antagonist